MELLIFDNLKQFLSITEQFTAYGSLRAINEPYLSIKLTFLARQLLIRTPVEQIHYNTLLQADSLKGNGLLK